MSTTKKNFLLASGDPAVGKAYMAANKFHKKQSEKNRKATASRIRRVCVPDAPSRKKQLTHEYANDEDADPNSIAVKTITKETPVVSGLFSELTFPQLDLNPHLTKNITERMNMNRMTHIQASSFAPISAGYDVMIRANTGSGKTLAYLLPIIQELVKDRQGFDNSERKLGTLAMILAPTRELCMQISGVLQKLVRPFPEIVPGSLMGGEKRKSEKARLRKGITVLVATPGRLLDHMSNTASFSFEKLRWLVFDEADMLLELGFERDMKRILSEIDEKRAVPNPRQTMLISATLKEGVKKLAASVLRHDVVKFIDIHSTPIAPAISLDQLPESKKRTADDADLDDENPIKKWKEDGLDDTEARERFESNETQQFQTPEGLIQHYAFVECKQRLITLSFFIFSKLQEGQKMVIFMSNINSVEFHHSVFARITMPGAGNVPIQLEDGKNIFKLHGDMSQVDRSKIFSSFSKSTSAVLFCTDVAARGLDLPAISWIVQYDPPQLTSEYVHRVGRTARIGTTGNSLIFLLPSEESYLNILKSHDLKLSEINVEDILGSMFYDDYDAEIGEDVDQFEDLEGLEEDLADREIPKKKKAAPKKTQKRRKSRKTLNPLQLSFVSY
eukprot:TRINITY_DN12416_c0_g1_i1.p1 TRINITY_DN12416_c0_g1~~TRINITY_DN12416_c0_g1_i1.p1  ORF type:complete len:617 (-),score=242.31 TRINITY_DN12416_c0_g1_i1:23-1873(-)